MNAQTQESTVEPLKTPSVREALLDCIESLKRLPDVEGAYRATCIWQAELALAANP